MSESLALELADSVDFPVFANSWAKRPPSENPVVLVLTLRVQACRLGLSRIGFKRLIYRKIGKEAEPDSGLKRDRDEIAAGWRLSFLSSEGHGICAP